MARNEFIKEVRDVGVALEPIEAGIVGFCVKFIFVALVPISVPLRSTVLLVQCGEVHRTRERTRRSCIFAGFRWSKMGKTERRPKRARSKTRSDKPRLLESGEEVQIKTQLASRGLMISNGALSLLPRLYDRLSGDSAVLGDGNCMFRALSDQIYGNPNTHHVQIRDSVCSYLASNEARYKLFVDEDSVQGGFLGHVESMRQPGTFFPLSRPSSASYSLHLSLIRSSRRDVRDPH